MIFLFSASLFFYSYWSFKYVFLLLFTVVMDFYLGIRIHQTERPAFRKILLLISVVTNLSILAFFKYYNFFSENVNYAFAANLPHLDIILPIGISFYTFQSMSYVIDVYRKESDTHDEFLPFATYVTLFPHQISGPLVRHNTIIPQLESVATYLFNSKNLWRGLVFFVLGLGKKVLIADRLAAAINPLIANMHSASRFEAVLAMLGYTMQLYFDFSGYSDMAVGLGLMMNIQFPQNFNSPYKSFSITEFWQRWHISLSSWLRDYLYISLGGNRRGSLITYRNLFLTMVIGGMWHGANWTFLIWGALHGFFLSLERLLKGKFKIQIPKFIAWSYCFLIVNVGWVFFRADNLTMALVWLKKIFLWDGAGVAHGVIVDIAGLSPWHTLHFAEKHKDRFALALTVALVLAFLSKNTWQIDMKPRLGLVLGAAVIFVAVLMYLGTESPFLYFQF